MIFIGSVLNAIALKLSAFNNWPKGVDRALSTKDVLLDPDTFGGKEDRLPYVEQAFINAKEQTKSH